MRVIILSSTVSVGDTAVSGAEEAVVTHLYDTNTRPRARRMMRYVGFFIDMEY